jgi:DNA-binding HxlR family transcriptional regulator
LWYSIKKDTVEMMEGNTMKGPQKSIVCPSPSRRRYGCGVEATLDLIGGKWKGVILFYLTYGTLRFNQLRRLLPEVTQRMLTLQLRELEEDGIVHREVYREIPPKVEYSLTPFGRSLEPILIQLSIWGDTYRQKIGDLNPTEVQDQPAEG